MSHAGGKVTQAEFGGQCRALAGGSGMEGSKKQAGPPQSCSQSSALKGEASQLCHQVESVHWLWSALRKVQRVTLNKLERKQKLPMDYSPRQPIKCHEVQAEADSMVPGTWLQCAHA